MACKKDHSAIQNIMSSLPVDQEGRGRHKCAACAYEQDYKDGLVLKEQINLDSVLDNLEESQAKGQRHKSSHTVEFVYILDDWFKDPKYKDALDYIISIGCKYYFNYIPLNKLGFPVPPQE